MKYPISIDFPVFFLCFSNTFPEFLGNFPAIFDRDLAPPLPPRIPALLDDYDRSNEKDLGAEAASGASVGADEFKNYGLW